MTGAAGAPSNESAASAPPRTRRSNSANRASGTKRLRGAYTWVSASGRPLHQGIQQHIRWLERQLDDVTKDLADQIERSPVWRAKDDLLQSVPGVGPIVSAVLLAELPELGTLSHKQLATLAGVAPLARDSGTLRGKWMVWGGRAGVRTALYLAALCGRRWNPQLRVFYERLLAAGKPKKVALIACARKLLTILNAMLRDTTR